MDIGTVLKHYQIATKLGSGGMGEVYAAEDLKLGRRVALKVLTAKVASDPVFREQFKREARLLAAINHPNIVTIYSVEEAEGLRFITMELAEGKSLHDVIPKSGLAFNDLLHLAVPIAEALSAAHEQGITHRDLKPENIIVSDTESVKILDFGLAQLAVPQDGQDASTTQTLTTDDQIVGTVPFMAPEQVQGKPCDHRSDIFSLGVILYQMATGALPFKGETAADTISSILRDAPTPITDLKVGFPRHLGRIIRHCLEKEPLRRYQAARDVLNELEGLQREVESGESLAFQTSIAVLPFTDMSAQKDQRYFCDGMAEELINALTTIRDLRVVARTSAFSFRDKELDIREIGNRLNVATVLEGSVRKAGNRLRIMAQLVDVENGYHLWSEKYDREADDIFAIQDEIALQIAHKLELRLVGGPDDSLVKRRTENLQAYNLYLMGRHHWNRRSEDGFNKGIECFKKAKDEDPSYALAYAGLADCYTQLGDYGYLPPTQARSEAKKAALRAIEIDDTVAEAHASLAYLTLLYDWDWSAAEREFSRAIELNPSYATAHQWCAEYLTAMGRMEEAIEEIKRAQTLDPLSLIVNTIVGWVFYRARRFDQALEQCRKALELDPKFALTHHLLGWIQGHESRFEEAVAEARTSVELSGGASLMMASLGYALAASGEATEARKVLDELMELSKQQYVPAYDLALVYSGLGLKDQALAWLEKAYQERYGWLVYLNADPIWDQLRSEPGFRALTHKIGLPQ